MRALSDETEEMRRQLTISTENEKRTTVENDRLKLEINNTHNTSTEIHQQLNNEINNMRREVHEQRSKMKIAAESKILVDKELITMHASMTRLENELQKQNENQRMKENMQREAEQKMQAARLEADTVNENCKHLKNVITELEATLQRKLQTIEELNGNVTQLERDGLMEMRRMRLQLSSAEQELNELRPMVAMLQQDAADKQVAVNKLQSTTSGTVKGLLEELRASEEALSQERKRSQAEVIYITIIYIIYYYYIYYSCLL